MEKIWVANFYKDGKWTKGWMTLSNKTLETIEKWCSYPGCTVKFTTTERIK